MKILTVEKMRDYVKACELGDVSDYGQAIFAYLAADGYIETGRSPLRSSLSTARAQGIREGLEMGAKVAETHLVKWNLENSGKAVAAAIRAKIEEVKP